MTQEDISFAKLDIRRKQQVLPSCAEFELILWDGYSYDQAFPKRIKIIGKAEIIYQILDGIGMDYEDWDFKVIEKGSKTKGC